MSVTVAEIEQLLDVLTKYRIFLQDVMLLGLGQVEWIGSADESLIVTAWTALTIADLSHNSITNVDESVVSPT